MISAVRRIVAMAACALAVLTMPAWAQTVILYSRADQVHAQRVYGLAATFDAVVIDASLRPGEAWRPAIAEAIMRARVVLILWSKHAASSAEVGTESRLALASQARVVPVLLDDTPLPGGLSERHGVDWRRGACP